MRNYSIIHLKTTELNSIYELIGQMDENIAYINKYYKPNGIKLL